MALIEQFEVWVQRGNPPAWELVAAFPHLDLANTVAHNYFGRPVRLLHVSYENGAIVESHKMMELGSTRESEHAEEAKPPQSEGKRARFGGIFGRKKA